MKFIIDSKVNGRLFKKIDCLLLPIWLNKKDGKGVFGGLFAELHKIDQALIKQSFQETKLKPDAVKLIRLNIAPHAVFIVGLDVCTERKFMLLVRQFIRTAKAEGFKNLGVYCDDFERANINAVRAAEIITEQSLVAHFDFAEQFKTAPKDGWKMIESVHCISYHNNNAFTDAMTKGEIVGNAINTCRMLSEYPPGDMTPTGLAEHAQELQKISKKITVTIFDEIKLKAEGMNAILAVGKGSENHPRLIIMEYKGAKDADAPIVFVGKGVTFDSGGLNLKPGEGMTDMHMDMAGGAAVIEAMEVIAKLNLPINVVGLVPAAENMPSGLSYRQGDIITAYGGKTIEVGNTDAEGRVIMADAMEYAKIKKPALIVTIATLTSVAISALGFRASALFVKNNKALQDILQDVGEVTGDRVWPMPLWDEHDKEIEGHHADVTNTNKTGSRYGWAIQAAAFLWHFAKPLPFVHIDMAPRMTTIDDDHLAKGAAGFGVKLLTHIAAQWVDVKKTLTQ